MKKQQDAQTPLCGSVIEAQKVSAGLSGKLASFARHDLARLRIERNRAARHARGALARFTFP